MSIEQLKTTDRDTLCAYAAKLTPANVPKDDVASRLGEMANTPKRAEAYLRSFRVFHDAERGAMFVLRKQEAHPQPTPTRRVEIGEACFTETGGLTADDLEAAGLATRDYCEAHDVDAIWFNCDVGVNPNVFEAFDRAFGFTDSKKEVIAPTYQWAAERVDGRWVVPERRY